MPDFAKLETIDTRQAWAHEAHGPDAFTPWLAENLSRLSEALGIELELEGTEVAVDRFSADVLARNTFDDTRVLIENQLEVSDHNHLGQILTYLAGLEAKTVVWIAKDFREPHLSAISWLNDNTDDDISFFAVRLKVVRIADSPLAPVFEVVERPNNWERRLHKSASKQGSSELSQQRYEFWKAYVERIPGEREKNGEPGYGSNRWVKLPDLDLMISLYTAKSSVGLFIRAPLNGSHEEARQRFEALPSNFEKVLSTK
ncbi:MAG: hypothetical protein R2684_09095 [Pyrinomonadaceae bacterium]